MLILMLLTSLRLLLYTLASIEFYIKLCFFYKVSGTMTWINFSTRCLKVEIISVIAQQNKQFPHNRNEKNHLIGHSTHIFCQIPTSFLVFLKNKCMYKLFVIYMKNTSFGLLSCDGVLSNSLTVFLSNLKDRVFCLIYSIPLYPTIT